MSKNKTPGIYSETDDKEASTTVEVPKEYHKYVIRLTENTDGLEEYTEKVKQFLGEYVFIYQKAMNNMAALMKEIDEKIKAVQEKRFPNQPANEWCFEIPMLSKELEMHYGIMKPLYEFYKIIKQKDTEVFEKGYNNCNQRLEALMDDLIEIMK